MSTVSNGAAEPPTGEGADPSHGPGALAAGALAAAEAGDLDVRTLPHGARHEIIFSKLDALAPGQAPVIVNDHDPKPLKYQTSALWPDRFDWSYLESGPEVWRVAITRAD